MDLLLGQCPSPSGRIREGSACSTSAPSHILQHRCPRIAGVNARLQGSRSGRGRSTIAAAIKDLTAEEEADLQQYKDRDRWYLPTFHANDAPDWNAGTFLRSRQLAPGIKEVVLEAEVSRDVVPLRNAYRHVGQKARVRVNGGIEYSLPVARGPFPQQLNRDALFKARGDMHAGEIKAVKEVISVRQELPLLVEEAQAPELYKAAADDAVEVGPFEGAGMDLRGPIIGMYAYPTVVIFCEGAGIAAARALAQAGASEGGLSFEYREDVRMYYRAPNQDALCFRDELEQWGERYHCKVITSTRDSFQDMFDDDDTLAYEPASTAAVILTGSDAEAEAAALAVCKEAEIDEIALESREQVQSVYLVKGSEGPTLSEKQKEKDAKKAAAKKK